jgi:RsiW-degrading membrane proteinase PrsW (M82 family)
MNTIIKWHCGCGKLLTAPADAAGKKGRCPQCKAVVAVPAAAASTPAAIVAGTQTNLPQPAVATRRVERPSAARTAPPPLPAASSIARLPSPAPRVPVAQRAIVAAGIAVAEPIVERPAATPVVQPRIIPAKRTRRSLREFLYFALALALVPLALDTFTPSGENIIDRLRATAKEHPEIAPRLRDWSNRMGGGKADFEELFNILPDHEVAGAFLPRDSHMHWVLALGSAGMFFVLLLGLFPSARLNRLALGGVGLLTATVGVLLLIGFQYAAEWTQGHNLIGRSIIVLIFYIVKFIGFSYSCANDPRNGFLLSFFGYTLGVGMCEEICKAMPLMARFQNLDGARDPRNNWQSACLWGMASGFGFGIAEGILYSGSTYNGVSSGLIYLVRFVSCVTLHAVWAASVGIRMFNRQNVLRNTGSWYEYALQLLLTIGVAMTLHGLYDTLFKKDMPVAALCVAVVSFCWLAFQIESMRRTEPVARPMRAGLA